MQRIIRLRCTFIILGGLLGFACQKLQLPVPYMLGGIIVGAGGRFSFAPDLEWPQNWRAMGMAVAGYGIGRSFTLATAQAAYSQFLGISLATFVAFAMSLMAAVWAARTSKVNLITCVMAMLPGGINQMMLMSEDDDRVDPNAVLVGQILRICLVVLVVPFLIKHFLGVAIDSAARPLAAPSAEAISWLILVPLGYIGYYAARRLHIPTPPFLGPILSAIVAALLLPAPLEAAPPTFMSFAQLNIGLYYGTKLDKQRLLATRSVLVQFIVSSLAMIAASVVVAEYLCAYYDFSLLTAFLAMAPGGITGMCLIALSVESDVAVVLVYQLARILATNFLGPLGIMRYFGKNKANS